MWKNFEFCFLCFNNIYSTIYCNVLIKYNKIEKNEFIKNKSGKKRIHQKWKWQKENLLKVKTKNLL